MAKPHLMFDKTEITMIIVTNKSARAMNITYDKIQSINIGKAKTKKFGIIPTEDDAITFRIAGFVDEIPFFRSKEKAFFDGYVTEAEAFAKRNRLTFYNNLKG